MWRGPTGGSASPRSCDTNGGGGSGWSATCCWPWTAPGVRQERQPSGRVRLPEPSNRSVLCPPRPLVDGGDQRGVSEMVAVYDNRLVKKTAPGRRIYDKIFTSAPNDKCPLCGHRNVKTLDHYLPKALFPALTVTPINLIPACSDCNKAKLSTAPT